MKKLELRQLIREEVRKVLKEGKFDTETRSIWRALCFDHPDQKTKDAFKIAFDENSFKFSKDLVPTFLKAIETATGKSSEEVKRIFSPESKDTEAVAEFNRNGLWDNKFLHGGIEVLERGIGRLK
jgi:hypothetical protein